MLDRLKVFTDDEQPGPRQQRMNTGNASAKCVLDRDHAHVGLAGADSFEGFAEGLTGNGIRFRKDSPAGQVGIGPGDALEGDGLWRKLRVHGSDDFLIGVQTARIGQNSGCISSFKRRIAIWPQPLPSMLPQDRPPPYDDPVTPPAPPTVMRNRPCRQLRLPFSTGPAHRLLSGMAQRLPRWGLLPHDAVEQPACRAA